MKVTLILLALVVCAAAVPKFHRVKNNGGPGVSAYQDIIIDEEEQYTMVTTTPGALGKASVNFHDIITGFSAIKDINEGTCYIFQANHTLRELKDRVVALNSQLGASEMKHYEMNCERQAMSNVFLRRLAGDRIASFCEDYTSTLVDRTPTRLGTRSDPHHVGQYWCVLCFNMNVPC